MLINPQTVTCQDDILSEVDKAILKTAKKLRDNLRFGFNKEINNTYFNNLLEMRDIYNNKQQNATWLCDFSEGQIKSSLQKALREA